MGFWFDNWVGVGPLYVLFPKVLSGVQHRVFHEIVLLVRGEVESFRRPMRQFKEIKSRELLSLLLTFLLAKMRRDSHIGKPSPLREFSTKGASRFSFGVGRSPGGGGCSMFVVFFFGGSFLLVSCGQFGRKGIVGFSEALPLHLRDIISAISTRITECALAKEFINLNFNDFVYNWEA